MIYRRFLKRAIDFTVALGILLCIWPVLLFVAIGLRFSNRGAGVLFLQPRPGHNNLIFRIIKFKTMTDARDATGELLADQLRLTPFGRAIRSLSIDELPQLVNVLKGDMSLIGPRPLLVDYLALYSPRQLRRHEVRPGMSGWAQVNGRNAIGWDQKFELDVWYVDHLTWRLDLKIVLQTIKKVCIREGIHSQTSETSEKFNGNQG